MADYAVDLQGNRLLQWISGENRVYSKFAGENKRCGKFVGNKGIL